MANRRMFSKTITNSSNFLMMSQSAQNLYFHLGMNADDDGFCEHFATMRMTDSKPDDLSMLHAKGFVFIFDQRILIIKDWKEHNYIRSDRYTASKYLDVYSSTLEAIQSDIPYVIPDGIPMVTTGKVRLGEVSKGKERKKKKAFVKPGIEEIEEYCKERGNSIDPIAFFDFYESKGWMVGKNKMTNWKACVGTWERREEGGKEETTAEQIARIQGERIQGERQ